MKRSANRKAMVVILCVLVLSVTMNLVDALLKPPYAVKSAIKVALFLIVPLIYFRCNRADGAAMLALLRPKKRGLLLGGAIGGAVLVAILGGYAWLGDFIDLSAVTASLTGDSGITADNFLYVALYISLCNSFLEEFFFRGFAFMILRRHTSRWVAYLLSAFLFAFYHIGMTLGWVEIWLFVLELLGLMAAGLFFDLINEKTETLYPSWLIHLCANIGINTVGCILFGIF